MIPEFIAISVTFSVFSGVIIMNLFFFPWRIFSLILDARNQYGIDCHAYHYQKCLERKGKKSSEIIRPYLPPLSVRHGGKRDRGD